MKDVVVTRKGSLSRTTVVMANPLIEACYFLTNLEQRIVSIMVSQIDDKRDTEVYTYDFTIKEFSRILGLEASKDKYKRIDEVFDRLSQRNIRIDPKYSVDGSRTFTNWGTFKYWTGKGKVSISINNEIAPYLLQLKGNWTKYRLEEVLKFRGEYTIRFFQWFMQEKNKPSQAKRSVSGAWYLRLSLQEIRKRLEMIDIKTGDILKYERWPDFRRRVLEPVEAEINSKSSIEMNWEAVKEGKAVKEILFHCAPQKTSRTPKLSQLGAEESNPRNEESERISMLLRMLPSVPMKLQAQYFSRHAEILENLKSGTGPRFSTPEILEEMATAATMEELGEEIEGYMLNPRE